MRNYYHMYFITLQHAVQLLTLSTVSYTSFAVVFISYHSTRGVHQAVHALHANPLRQSACDGLRIWRVRMRSWSLRLYDCVQNFCNHFTVSILAYKPLIVLLYLLIPTHQIPCEIPSNSNVRTRPGPFFPTRDTPGPQDWPPPPRNPPPPPPRNPWRTPLFYWWWCWALKRLDWILLFTLTGQKN